MSPPTILQQFLTPQIRRRSMVRFGFCYTAMSAFNPWCLLSQSSNKQAEGKPTTPKFDVVSIKSSRPGSGNGASYGPSPDGYHARGQSLWQTILIAYYPLSHRYWRDAFPNTPRWLGDKLYDIDAKVSESDLPAWRSQGSENPLFKQMLQEALIVRCHLAVHAVSTSEKVYDLSVGKGGLRNMKPTTPGENIPSGAFPIPLGGMLIPSRGDLRFFATSMQALAGYLTGGSADRPVMDATGLLGLYDFTLPREQGTADDPTFMASIVPYRLSELGLYLKSGVGTIPRLVLDHVEEPSLN